MKTDLFMKYVEASRDCDAALLDIAVNKGLLRAKDSSFDYKKLVSLAAACVVTAAVCFLVNMEPVKIAAFNFVHESSNMTESGLVTLHGYLNDIANTIIKYLGGT